MGGSKGREKDRERNGREAVRETKKRRKKEMTEGEGVAVGSLARDPGGLSSLGEESQSHG